MTQTTHFSPQSLQTTTAQTHRHHQFSPTGGKF